MLLFASLVDVPSFFRFSTGSPPLLAYDKVLATALKIVELWNPLHLSVGPCRYDGVFMDRPEAGWMLYLPRPLSPQQVPEAHTLVPVMKPDATGQPQQTGTVVVSIDDGPFSEENPAHVKRAHDIEIRLAAQGLLPRFGDAPPPR